MPWWSWSQCSQNIVIFKWIHSDFIYDPNFIQKILLYLKTIIPIILFAVLLTKNIIFSSKSVKISFMPMAKELVRRGHNVTIISPHKGGISTKVNIFIVFTTKISSKSIKISVMPMAKELARRGHNVSIVSPHKGKKKLFRQCLTKKLFNYFLFHFAKLRKIQINSKSSLFSF